MGNFVELRSANCSSLKEAQADQGESVWPIRDRRHDIPALLWLGCFEEANFTIEVDDEDPYGYLFCSRIDALKNLVKCAGNLQSIFPNNSGVTGCAEHLINHLQNIDCLSLYLPLRLFDWHEDAGSWTRQAINVLQGLQESNTEEIALRFNINLAEKTFWQTKWASFVSPEEYLKNKYPQSDWDRTGSLVGWDTDES